MRHRGGAGGRRFRGDRGQPLRRGGDGLVRLARVPAGTRQGPYWHPRDERVTVLEGEVRVGFGDSFDEGKMTTFGPGSFYLNPPGADHYGWIVKDSLLQMTGMGSWKLHFVK
ncbi:MAG: cupin domain-containing protein [Armatimonadetes bacterium]|nr:cupin domain-containing protein [Armatimonadota bacterium]